METPVGTAATTTAYDHATKAGNCGDVWKHSVLTALVRAMLADRKSSSPFRYMESHAGAGRFSLNPKGSPFDWQKGVAAAATLGIDCPTIPWLGWLSPGYSAGSRYDGSWMLVRRLLLEAGLDHRMDLFDTSNKVRDAIRGAVADDHRIHVSGKDGFAGIRSTAASDLVLIDPAYKPEREWNQAADCAQSLASRGIPVAVWYFIAWPTKPDALVKRSGLTGIEVMWKPLGQTHNQNIHGAGILLGGGAERFLPAFSGDLLKMVQALGWQAQRRTSHDGRVVVDDAFALEVAGT